MHDLGWLYNDLLLLRSFSRVKAFQRCSIVPTEATAQAKVTATTLSVCQVLLSGVNAEAHIFEKHVKSDVLPRCGGIWSSLGDTVRSAPMWWNTQLPLAKAHKVCSDVVDSWREVVWSPLAVRNLDKSDDMKATETTKGNWVNVFAFTCCAGFRRMKKSKHIGALSSFRKLSQDIQSTLKEISFLITCTVPSHFTAQRSRRVRYAIHYATCARTSHFKSHFFSTVTAFGPRAMLLPALGVYESSPSSDVKVDAKTGEDFLACFPKTLWSRMGCSLEQKKKILPDEI